MSDHEGSRKQAVNRRAGRYLAPVGLGLAVLAGITEAVAGPGARLGLWHFRFGFTLLGIAAVAGGLGALVSFCAGMFAGRHKPAYRMAVAGIVIGLIAAGIPWSWSRAGKQVPRIHDITTDTGDPPAFEAILPFRADAGNSPVYGGPAVAEQQERAYPDIQPLVLTVRPSEAFDRALSVARDMGWVIVSSDPGKGRIEATATTFWFGFKDDVVVRITPLKEGTRVDIRSASRVGVGDAGTNAKRVRKFLEKMKQA
jgi:uncharacterized protein (DUF1499 family)